VSCSDRRLHMSEVIDQMIAYDGQEGRVDAYLAKPETREPRPGIVVIHDIFGLAKHTKDVARRFVRQGYVALAPHLYSRPSLARVLTWDRAHEAMRFRSSIPPEKLSDPAFVQEQASKLPEGERERVAETLPMLFGGIPRDSLVQDLVSAVEYLNAQSYVRRGRIGSVGFCFGGGLSFSLACRAPLAACVVFYGENPNPIELVENIPCPVLGLYGVEDMRINAHLDEMIKAMVTYQKELELKIYPNAAHAFFDDTSPQTYRHAAAVEAWDRVLRFYRQTLLGS
jgi:carboxymethylenebutenolidase